MPAERLGPPLASDPSRPSWTSFLPFILGLLFCHLLIATARLSTGKSILDPLRILWVAWQFDVYEMRNRRTHPAAPPKFYSSIYFWLVGQQFRGSIAKLHSGKVVFVAALAAAEPIIDQTYLEENSCLLRHVKATPKPFSQCCKPIAHRVAKEAMPLLDSGNENNNKARYPNTTTMCGCVVLPQFAWARSQSTRRACCIISEIALMVYILFILPEPHQISSDASSRSWGAYSFLHWRAYVPFCVELLPHLTAMETSNASAFVAAKFRRS